MGGATWDHELCFRGAGDAGRDPSCYRASDVCGFSPPAAASIPSLLGRRRHRRHEQEEEAVLGHARPARLRAGAGPRVRPGAGRALGEGARVWAAADSDGEDENRDGAGLA